MTCEDVIREAYSWVGTPYHKRARIKGVGADCFTFIAEVMITCGLFTRDELPAYQDDWFLHQREEVYLRLLFRYCRKTLEAISYPSAKIQPGHIVVMRTTKARIFNHGGIVVKWPKIIHCIYEGVQEVDASRDELWNHKQVLAFDPWVKP